MRHLIKVNVSLFKLTLKIFSPLITEELLNKALNWAQQFIDIDDEKIKI